jgi:hypothetical protein
MSVSCYTLTNSTNNPEFNYIANQTTSFCYANIDTCALNNVCTGALLAFTMTGGTTANSTIEVSGGRYKTYGVSANGELPILTLLTDQKWDNNAELSIPDIELVVSSNMININTTLENTLESNVYFSHKIVSVITTPDRGIVPWRP